MDVEAGVCWVDSFSSIFSFLLSMPSGFLGMSNRENLHVLLCLIDLFSKLVAEQISSYHFVPHSGGFGMFPGFAA